MSNKKWRANLKQGRRQSSLKFFVVNILILSRNEIPQTTTCNLCFQRYSKIINSYLFSHILQPFFIPTVLKNIMSPFSMDQPILRYLWGWISSKRTCLCSRIKETRRMIMCYIYLTQMSLEQCAVLKAESKRCLQ